MQRRGTKHGANQIKTLLRRRERVGEGEEERHRTSIPVVLFCWTGARTVWLVVSYWVLFETCVWLPNIRASINGMLLLWSLRVS